MSGDKKTELRKFLTERSIDRDASTWDKLRKGKDLFVDVPWPKRPDITVRMRVLTSSESQVAVAEAYKRFEQLGLPLSPLTVEEYHSEEVTQKLALAMRDPETDELVFESGDCLRDVSKDGERLSLMATYEALVSDTAPDLGEVSSEDMARIAAAVKKKDPVSLKSFGLDALVTYMLTTADQPWNSQTDSSTPGE